MSPSRHRIRADGRSNRAQRAVRLLALVGAVLAVGWLAGCGGSDVQVMDESGQEWVARGDTCVRQSEEEPVRRVINRTDPELCGRSLKHRPPVYVRVLPPPGMRSR